MYALFYVQMDIQMITKKNEEIPNLDNVKTSNNEYLYHAGTKKKNNKFYAVGGRVLSLVSISDDFSSAKEKIISKLEELNWSGGFYRKDIGYKVIK